MKKSVFLLLPPSNNGELYSRVQNLLKAFKNLDIDYGLYYKTKKSSFFRFILGLFPAFIGSLKYDYVFLFISRISPILIIFYKLILRKKVLLDHFATSETAFNRKGDSKYLKSLERFSFRLCDVVITHTETMKRVICEYSELSKNDIYVIYGVVDVKLFKREKNITRNNIVFVYHGLFHKWHGLDYFLKAFKKVLNVYPNAQCIFIGANRIGAESYFSEFKNFSDNMRFVPRISNSLLPKYLSLGDFWIGRFTQDKIGKRSASFCMFEAMSIGLVPITSRSFENEKVIKDGINGILVKEENSNEIVQKILYYLKQKDKIASMSLMARQTILDHYSIHNMETVLRKIFKP